MQNAMMMLRGRAAWAHNFDSERDITGAFQILPASSFVVFGAAQAHDAADSEFGVEHLEIYLQTDLPQHLADHGGLDLQILRGDKGDRQSIGIPRLPEQVPCFTRSEGVGRQRGIMPEALERD